MSAPRLSGLKVLVVEDEATVSFLIEDMLQEFGCEIVASAATLAKACRIAETATLDFALLDVNLNGERAFPAAEILQNRDIPFVFSTGYGALGLPAEFANRPVIAKPFSSAQLRQRIFAALEGRDKPRHDETRLGPA